MDERPDGSGLVSSAVLEEIPEKTAMKAQGAAIPPRQGSRD